MLRAAGEIRHERRRADSGDGHVSDLQIVRGTHDKRERLAVGQRTGGRIGSSENQDRRLVGDDIDHQFGEWPFIAEAVGRNGAHRCETSRGQGYVGAERRRAVGAERSEVLGEPHAGAGFAHRENGLDRNGSAGHRRPAIGDLQGRNVGSERVECCEGDDERLIRRPVARQVEHVAHRQRVGRVDLERRVWREGQHESVQPDVVRAGRRTIGTDEREEVIRVANRFVERKPHHRARVDLNGAVGRKDRHQTRRIVVRGREAGNERRHQRAADQVRRAASYDPSEGILPLAIDDDDFVGLFALQRRQRRHANQTRDVVGRVRQQLDGRGHVARARIEPQINAVRSETVARQRLVEEKLNGRRDRNSHRGIRRRHIHDARVILVEPHVAEVQHLAVARQRRR